MMQPSANILVADSEPDFRRHILEYLERLGYTADAASTGDEALRAIEATEYALVLLDSTLTLGDGGDPQRLISERRPEISLVVMASAPSVRAVIQALRRGAMDYIIKPYEITELTTIVPRAVERYFARTTAGGTTERVGAAGAGEVRA